MSVQFDEKIRKTLADAKLELAVYTATGRLATGRRQTVAPEVFPQYEELRTQASAIKKHTIDNLDYYLEQLQANVEAHGGKVVYCRDSAEVVDFVVKLAREKNAPNIVKSKSMATEELDLNEHLKEHGLEPVETDLGEFLVQLAGQRPYHIVGPSMHMTRYDVAELFTKHLGVERETDPPKQTMIARRVLREKFLKADIGISGANFLVADSGAVVLVTNEGNARLTTTLPRIHIAIAGIEKLIPRAQDLAVFLNLLSRSSTGQLLTVYTSFLSGPRRAGEIDGPDEFYVVLIDNGRTRLLPDEGKRQSLHCIRCGACLNICPVYRKIGGHSFPWIYSGPIGAIITPQFLGITHEPALPFASSLCGACSEVCPVKIDIPKILLELRAEVNRATASTTPKRLERLGFRLWSWLMRHPRIYEWAGLAFNGVAPEAEPGKWLSGLPGLLNVGPAKAWASGRDLPPAPGRSFRAMWRARSRSASR
jgi:L-lactate dehydrogenase complex protein LldF